MRPALAISGTAFDLPVRELKISIERLGPSWSMPPAINSPPSGDIVDV